MYEVTFPAATSSAGWSAAVEIIDDSTGRAIADLSSYRAQLAVMDSCGNAVLSADSDAGTITIVASLGQLKWSFSPDDMSGLCPPQTLNVGLTLTNSDGTRQILVGKLPFIDGYV